MTDKVNLPVRKFIEQKIADNFKDIDFRRGTAFNDLFVKPAAMLMQPFRHEINMLKVNQSILNFDNMSAADIDLLIGNIFIRRAAAAKAMGTVRIYFRNPGIYKFDVLIFMTQGGLRFLNTSTINTTVESLLQNRSDEGYYYLDTIVQAEYPGSAYSVKSGEIQLMDNQPSQILSVENIDSFGMVTDEEDNSQLYAKARRSISVRNLINDSSIQSVLFNEFTFIRDIFVVNAGDNEMIRDLLVLPTSPPIQIHTGGKTDIYIDTTGIEGEELLINSIPENGIVDCISQKSQSLLFKHESGVLDDIYFFDYENSFFSQNGLTTIPLLIRGNKLKVITREFGQTVENIFNIEQLLEDNRVRISNRIKYSNIDGVILNSGNIINDLINGEFKTSYGVLVNDVFSHGAGDAWRIGNVNDSSLEIKPNDEFIANATFQSEIPANSIINYLGIGINVLIDDVLHIYSSSAWGKYKVVERINNDTIFVIPVDANESISSVTFTGTNTFSGSIAVGTYVTRIDNGVSYRVTAPGEFDKSHNYTGILNCYLSDDVLKEIIPINTQFQIKRSVVKKDITNTHAITDNVSAGSYFFKANSDYFNLGDEVVFGSIRALIIGKKSDMLQVDTALPATSTGYIPVVYRYANSLFNSNTIFNRYENKGFFNLEVTVPTSTLNVPFIGVNAFPGYKLIIHTGQATGIYTVDHSDNPNSVTLTTSITEPIVIGDQFSIIASINQVGSAHDDVLYVPYFNNDFTSLAATFPHSPVDQFLIITNGDNKGVYEVAEYLDPNRVRINGSLSNTGDTVVTNVKFNSFTASGSTTITETGTPFTNVNVNDTLIIDRNGSLSYHNIVNKTLNTLDINPRLSDDIVGDYTSYTIIHDTMNPFVIVTSEIPFEIHEVPYISDRRSEGLYGNCISSSFSFTDSTVNFIEIFSGVDPDGYELYILEGTHARTEPYIIQSVSNATSLIIKNTTIQDTENFNVSGFIGFSSPSDTEKYEIKKSVKLLHPVNYEIYEDYSYYGTDFFKLPILALRDIYRIDSVTGELDKDPLIEGTDYVLGVKEASTRYSIFERIFIQFIDTVKFRYEKIRVRYYSDPNVKLVHDFAMSAANRITNNSILIKRMESTFVEIDITLEGNVELQSIEDTINEYITTRKSKEPIEASDIIQKLYDLGITYVDTETLRLRSIYYTSDGQRLASESRTRVVSASTATYIPGAINITLIPTT